MAKKAKKKKGLLARLKQSAKNFWLWLFGKKPVKVKAYKRKDGTEVSSSRRKRGKPSEKTDVSVVVPVVVNPVDETKPSA